MKASDLFVKALESEGVEYVFGIPGEENLDFLESLRPSSIRLVLTRHKQAAGANRRQICRMLQAFVKKPASRSSAPRRARAWSTNAIQCFWVTPHCRGMTA